jgi:hypothetical protein
VHASVAVVLLGAGVSVGLTRELKPDSIELSVRPFADLGDQPRIAAFSMRETPRVILGLAGVDRSQRQAFIEAHLREAYLDPAGDRSAWVALIAVLAEEGLEVDVAGLRALPFAVELDPQLTAALQADQGR